MGCAAALVAFLAIIIGLVVLPTTVNIVGNMTPLINITTVNDWSVLSAAVQLLPFAFLCLILLAAVWAFVKPGSGGG